MIKLDNMENYKKVTPIKPKDILKYCTMCDVRTPLHQGTIKCIYCNCWMCNKHIQIMKLYDNQCPSCWCLGGDEECFLCRKNLTKISEK